MQTDLVEYLFGDILGKFSHVFSFCELGFRNELMIQMFSRKIRPGTSVMWPGRNFDQVHFVMKGQVECQLRNGLCFFKLTPGTVFGDYQILLGLKSNMLFRVPQDLDQEQEDVHVMGVYKEVFFNLLEMYPKTQEALQELCLLKREIMLHYMEMNVNFDYKPPLNKRMMSIRRRRTE